MFKRPDYLEKQYNPNLQKQLFRNKELIIIQIPKLIIAAWKQRVLVLRKHSGSKGREGFQRIIQIVSLNTNTQIEGEVNSKRLLWANQIEIDRNDFLTRRECIKALQQDSKEKLIKQWRLLDWVLAKKVSVSSHAAIDNLISK